MQNVKERQHSLLTTEEILKDRQFYIPDYQRGYSWEKKHRLDLLKDITFALKKGSDFKHFTGTIVAFEKNNKFEIIDGQQRLVSIIILMRYIENKLHLPDSIINSETFRVQENDQNLFVENIIKKCIPEQSINCENQSQKNLIQAIIDYKDYFSTNINIDLEQYYNIIKQQLGFIFYVPYYTENAGLMFETINNRGKLLSQLDKIKNYYVYYTMKKGTFDSNELIFNDAWKGILKNCLSAEIISSEDEDAFIRYCWITYNKESQKNDYNIYNCIKEAYPEDINDYSVQLREFIRFTLEASKAIVKLRASSNKYIYDKLFYQFKINSASVMPLYLSIELKNDLAEERKIQLLELVEKLNFRLYICPGVL